MHGVPRSPALPAVDRPHSKSAAPVFRPRERPVVLSVDDDDGVREALHLILDESYAVLDVADGRTALGLIRERLSRPDAAHGAARAGARQGAVAE